VPSSDRKKPVILVLIGPPGSGKGTQAERLTRLMNIPAISTGAMLRAEMAANTELGKMAAAITFTGGLVGDEIVNKMIANRIAQSDCAPGFMLDGYPRTVAQAQYLDDLLSSRGLPHPLVLHIDVPDSVVVERICLRRQCPSCGHIYNLKFQPPANENLCDSDSCKLVTRSDDCEETVRARLTAYNASTAPLLTYYAGKRYLRVDGTMTPDEIEGTLIELLECVIPALAGA
jgi:adenylate kinase